MCAYVSFGVWVSTCSDTATSNICGDTTICFLIVMSKIALSCIWFSTVVKHTILNSKMSTEYDTMEKFFKRLSSSTLESKQVNLSTHKNELFKNCRLLPFGDISAHSWQVKVQVLQLMPQLQFHPYHLRVATNQDVSEYQ